MSMISDEELSALVSVERLYAIVAGLVGHYGIDEEATSIKIGGRYYSGSITISAIMDSADEVLERAKNRPVHSAMDAEEHRRREVSILTSFTYDDLRAKLVSMSPDEAAAEIGVSVALIEDWRGRLGIANWRPRS